MATEKLYYEDSEMYAFSGKVLSCTKAKKGYEVVLDRTAFYPEGGGQSCDLGTINGIPVTDVQEKGDEIVHTVKDAIPEGTEIEGKIDRERRIDLTQQHSGEHIVSGLAYRHYGFHNVGFHMNDEVITVDWDGTITWEQLLQIEEEANDYILENHPVRTFFPSREELEKLDYRSKKELSGQVRLVEYPGADLCACCGTHVKYTGEIGPVKFLSLKNFHGGVRVEMICGKRVMQYLSRLQDQNHEISTLLSAKPLQTAKAVEHLQQECQEYKQQIEQIHEKEFEKIAAAHENAGNVILFEDGLDPVQLRKLCVAVMERCGGICAAFSKRDEKYLYAIGQQDGNLRDFVKAFNKALSGKGGGKDAFFAQGSVSASEEEIREYLEK